MLINSLLLTAIAAVSLLPGLVGAAPTPVYHDNGSVEMVTDSTDKDGNLVKRSIWLYFVGCNNEQKFHITQSWRNMVHMGEAIKNKVDFNQRVAIDYLGDPDLNKANQDNINAMINTVWTWSPNDWWSIFGWHLKMRCDDPNHKARQRGASFPDGCPAGAKREDFDKCASKCWAPQYPYGDRTNLVWKPAAMAYTTSYWPSKLIADINWCPGWFQQKPCEETASTWSNSKTAGKYDMVNYQCREQSMVHELFHIDHNWQRHAPSNGHVMDREMRLEGEPKPKKAYGPLYTKVLARWAKSNVGHYVATNADNLAHYFLGKWVQEQYGVYPHLPITDEAPIGFVQSRKRDDEPIDPVDPPTPPTDNPWDTPETWDPIRVVDGKVRLGDLNDLADALGVETIEEARTLYDENPDDCLNFVSQDENDENFVCADSDEVIELDASKDITPPVDPQSTPVPTDTTPAKPLLPALNQTQNVP